MFSVNTWNCSSILDDPVYNWKRMGEPSVRFEWNWLLSGAFLIGGVIADLVLNKLQATPFQRTMSYLGWFLVSLWFSRNFLR